jgi:KDO2-lipid IV(A) lauroyltransferase
MRRALVHRLEYVAYLVLSRGVRLLPHRRVRAFGERVGRLAYRFFGVRRRLTLDNIAAAYPGLPQARREQIARGCFEHFGATFLEAFSVTRYQPAEILDLFDVEGVHHVHAALAEGKGLLVIAGHYGAWDMAAYPLGSLLDDFCMLIRHQNNALVAADIDRVRSATGATTLPRHRSAHRMLNVLRRGGVIALAMDQRVRPNEGVLIPFLGRLAWTSKIPGQLATVLRSPAVPLCCEPTDDGRYRLTFHPVIHPGERTEAEIFRLTRAYVESVEADVARKPERWLWPHTRWQRTARNRWPSAIERIRKEAALPDGPALTEIAGDDLDAAAVRTFAEIDPDDGFLETCTHLTLVGGTRPRRTRLAIGFARATLATGFPVSFTRIEDLLSSLAEARDADRLPTRLRHDDQRPLMVLDAGDLTALGADERGLLGRFIAHRQPRGSLLLACDDDTWEPAEGDAPGDEAIRAFFDSARALRLAPRGSDSRAAEQRVAHLDGAAAPDTAADARPV